MLTLGYKASAEQFGPRELLDFGIQAERTGFDSVFVSDHYQPWRHTDGHAPNCFAWLGALAARTERIAIGTSVLTPTFRYHPAIVAQAMATIGCLAEGRRVILGVGTGESLNEVPLGIEWPDQPERFARLKEASELIRRLWSEEFVTFEGEFFKTRNATVYDRPSSPSSTGSPHRAPPRHGSPGGSPMASSARRARAWSSTPRRSCPASRTAPRRRAGRSTGSRR